MHLRLSAGRRRGAQGAMPLWALLTMVVLGLVGVALALAEVPDRMRFVLASTTAEAAITDRRAIQRSRSTGRSSFEYRVSWRYTTAEGASFTGWQSVTQATHDSLREGQVTTVRYLTAEPRRSRLDGYEVWLDLLAPGFAMVLGLSFAGYGVVQLGRRAMPRRGAPGIVPAAADGPAPAPRPAPPPGMRPALSWARLVRRQNLWLPVLLVAMGLGFGAAGAYLLDRDQRLARDGIEVMAEVTDRDSYRPQGQNQRTRYRIGYRFLAADGAVVEGYASVSLATHGRLRVGQTVPVRYLPDRPSEVQIDPPNPIFPLSFAGAGLMLVLLGLGMGRRKLGDALSIRRALARGDRRQVRVTGHVATDTVVANQTLHRFAWQDGMALTGQSGPLSPDHLPPIGAEVTLWVDPRTGRAWSEHEG